MKPNLPPFILHLTYNTVLYFILLCLLSVPLFTAREILLQLLG